MTTSEEFREAQVLCRTLARALPAAPFASAFANYGAVSESVQGQPPAE